MENLPKICKDCKHYFIYFAEKTCNRMAYKEYNVVTGDEEIHGVLECSNERYYDNLCGYAAKYFEPKS